MKDPQRPCRNATDRLLVPVAFLVLAIIAACNISTGKTSLDPAIQISNVTVSNETLNGSGYSFTITFTTVPATLPAEASLDFVLGGYDNGPSAFFYGVPAGTYQLVIKVYGDIELRSMVPIPIGAWTGNITI